MVDADARTSSGIGPGTGGGADSISPPTPVSLGLPPLDIPRRVRPYSLVAYYDVDVRQYEEVAEVRRDGEVFRLQTRRADAVLSYAARNVVIATGYFDTPRPLDVPGADLSKVVHYFSDPFPYFQQDVVVVGAGNSAADAALTCWREGARVTLVHLFEGLDRNIKPWVRPDIENRIAEGAIPALWRHRLVEIRPREVVVEDLETGECRALPNDWVLAMTGYVEIDPETGIPTHDRGTMETNARGVFVAGVLAAGYDANKIFIENGKLHGPLITAAVAAR